MPRKLNDKQLSELVIEYANGTSISALAKKYKIDRATATKYIKNSTEFQQKFNTIKKENAESVLKAFADNGAKAIRIIETSLSKIEQAIQKDGVQIRDLAGLIKIIAEVYGNINSKQGNTEDNEIKINLEIKDLSGENNEN